MHKIYWNEEEIGFLSDQVESDIHKHWMYQLFLSVDCPVTMQINGKRVIAQCIIVDMDTKHQISTNDKLYFSLIISASSRYAKSIKQKMNGMSYYSKKELSDHYSDYLDKMSSSNETESYNELIDHLMSDLNIKEIEVHYDERIEKLILLLDSCDCYTHSLTYFADQLHLSTSRLSHLFKEEVGVPLKSYILLHQVQSTFEKLLQGNSITQACSDTGFDSPSHFAATVKKLMGTPASFSIKDSVFLKV